jgi:hypothetical protein
VNRNWSLPSFYYKKFTNQRKENIEKTTNFAAKPQFFSKRNIGDILFIIMGVQKECFALYYTPSS